MKKFNIGDIVFVSNYKYKNGGKGQKHIFIIIDDGQVIDIEYYGFIVSSQLSKETYPYNEKIEKNKLNNLRTDSIVKCDDLIKIDETEIEFKIGEVKKKELERFIDTFIRYLSK